MPDTTDVKEAADATPEPDPRLVAVQEAAGALIAACERLPNVESRGHALAHARSVPIWAAHAIREEAEGG
jgi:hypothetical protein